LEAGAVHPAFTAFVAGEGGTLYPGDELRGQVGLPVIGLVELVEAGGRML